MANTTVVCLGEILIDQVVLSSGQRQNYPGGAPANVAAALAKLGVMTEFVGCVGNDPVGQSLVDLLEQLAVGQQGLQRSDRPTRTVEVRCNEQGDRTFGGFLGGVNTDFADAHLAAEELPEALFQQADCLVTGTLGLAYPATRAAMAKAAALTQASGGKIIIDLNWRPTFWPQPQAADLIEPWLNQADWLKLSADEAIELFNTSEAPQLAARFPSAQGILVTDGDRGCQYQIANGAGKLPAFKVASQDTTGAGDAFLAGVIDQLHQSNWQITQTADIEHILTFASGLGALTTLKAGAIAAQPSLDELLTFLTEHTHKA